MKNISHLLPILEIFTKEYKEETKYRGYMKEHVDDFKLKNDNAEPVEETMRRLQ